MHLKWPNYHGYSGYVISGPNTTIAQIRNHDMVHFIQKENKFQASSKTAISFKNLDYSNFKSTNTTGGKSAADIYILDSGIDVTHPDFEGRASWGWPNTRSKKDKFGHGTFVAGVAASKHFGIAKSANLIAVKVLDNYGMGSSSVIINGVNYILNRVKRNPSRKAIINISFSGPKDPAVDHILDLAVRNGIAVVAAAGNDDSDACEYSPSRSSMVLTVGSINNEKSKTKFSNHGSCVDVWALGVSVRSLWPNGQTHKMDGTSTSAPRIAGYLALLWSDDPQLSPVPLYQKLVRITST
jgi:serine protease